MIGSSALIGYSGFVGTTLLGQKKFTDLYRSTNINEIQNKTYDLAVIAAAPGKKWLANTNPFEDQKALDRLIEPLKKMRATQVVLISTVDVFPCPFEVDEDTSIDLFELAPYGYNRRRLELFVENNFKNHLIVRLPGLVGKGLRKNILFDFVHNNKIEEIESRNFFQFYPMENLWTDIQRGLDHEIRRLHLTSEPVQVSEVAKEVFGLTFDQKLQRPLIQYDFRSKYHNLWGKEEPYQYSKKESINAIKKYRKGEAGE